MARITENDLVLPALYIINRQPGITTSELSIELRAIFNPSGEDAEILKGRNDDKFSQIVRNLVSHHTLDQKYGFTVLATSKPTNSTHTLTESGAKYLQDNIESLEGLLSNSLGYNETINGIAKIDALHRKGRKFTVIDENAVITEGRKKSVSTKVYERSKRLRDKAIEANMKDGRIVCAACGFDFVSLYGEHGQGYIEIHHQKPIFQYEEDDFSKLITEALDDLIPLCSNCHRIVHHRRDKLLSLEELTEIIHQHQLSHITKQLSQFYPPNSHKSKGF